MDKQKLMFLDTKRILGKLTEGRENKYARVYFSALVKKIHKGDLYKTGTKQESIIPNWTTRYSSKDAKALIKSMLNDKFLTQKPDGTALFYEANPEIIKSIAGYYSFSKKESSTVSKIWSNPQESDDKTSKHDWYGRIHRVLRGRNLKFMDPFMHLALEENIRKQACLHDPEWRDTSTLLSSSPYKRVSDPLNMFLTGEVSKRIYDEHSLKKQCESDKLIYYQIMEKFLNEQVFMHLFTYPHPNVKVNSNPAEIILEFKDQDLIKIFGEMCSFMDKRENVMREYYTSEYCSKNYREMDKRGDWKTYFYRSFSNYLTNNMKNKWRKELDSKSKLSFRETPFLISLEGDAELIIRVLGDLENHIKALLKEIENG